MAEHAIECELGVKSQDTVWREHLYQLEGFHALLGGDLVERIKRRERCDDLSALRLPSFSLRVRDRDQLASFSDLTATAKVAEDGVLWVECLAQSGAVFAFIGLDLANELLQFDPERGVGVRHDEDQASLQGMADYLQLLKDLLCNGALEVVVAETGERLGRTDAYIGHNTDLAGSLENIDRILEELRTRLGDISGPQASPN